MKVLLVEDNERVAQFVRKGLIEAGHTVDHAGNSRDGLVLAGSRPYDAMIIDRMLPGGMDGLGIVAALRKTGDVTPVLILSALSDVDERIRGLNAGGDDYLTKPFAFGELAARLDALVRRSHPTPTQAALAVGDLQIDLVGHQVTRNGRVIELKPQEFKLLEYLMRHQGHVVTRTMLIESLWDYHFEPQTNVIDSHISKLRQKVDAGFDQPLIHTVRGFGYKLCLHG